MQRDLSKVKIATKVEIEKDLPEDLYSISGQKANQLAYKSMNPVIYYSLTLLLYAIEVVLAFTIDDIGQIFGFIGTFSGCGMSYFLPSMFVIYGFPAFGTQEFQEKNQMWKKLAYVNFFAGIFFFLLFLANNVLGIVYASASPAAPCVPRDKKGF